MSNVCVITFVTLLVLLAEIQYSIDTETRFGPRICYLWPNVGRPFVLLVPDRFLLFLRRVVFYSIKLRFILFFLSYLHSGVPEHGTVVGHDGPVRGSGIRAESMRIPGRLAFQGSREP